LLNILSTDVIPEKIPLPDPIAVAPVKPDWYHLLEKYAKTDLKKSWTHLLSSVLPYLALWALMIYLVLKGYPYWLTFVAIVCASVFFVRSFIIFHDCVHESFFNSAAANKIAGTLIGIMTFTPYGDWRHIHNIHHATYTNLDRRGVGDIWLITAEEYLAYPKFKQFIYRFYRNPLFLILTGPILQFLLIHRVPGPRARWQELGSVLLTDAAIAGIVILASYTIGLKNYLIIQLPIVYLSTVAGVWLFYVQHQFEGVYWSREKDWDPMRAALEGSSFYKLPKFLQWVTGNIGFHHVHHVRTRIPNYFLEQCYNEVPVLQGAKSLSIKRSLKGLWLSLWDEKEHRLISFAELRHRQKSPNAPTMQTA